MSVDARIPVIPLSKLAALNSLIQMPDTFHHETGAAKTSHSSIWCAKASLIRSFESETWRETRKSELRRSSRKYCRVTVGNFTGLHTSHDLLSIDGTFKMAQNSLKCFWNFYLLLPAHISCLPILKENAFFCLSPIYHLFFSLKVIKWKVVVWNTELQTCSAGSVDSDCSRVALSALAETERDGNNPSKIAAGGTTGSWHPPIPREWLLCQQASCWPLHPLETPPFSSIWKSRNKH